MFLLNKQTFKEKDFKNRMRFRKKNNGLKHNGPFRDMKKNHFLKINELQNKTVCLLNKFLKNNSFTKQTILLNKFLKKKQPFLNK